MESSDLPTERTPLMDRRSASESLPFILEFERNIYSDADYPAVHKVIERRVEAYTTSPSTELTLKLLLCLRYLSGAYFQLGKDDWIDSRSVEQDATELAVRCWTGLQRVAWSQAALDEALWTQFPLESGKKKHISLMEVILTNQAGLPLSIQLDDRIASSLLRIWKSGRPRSAYNGPMSTFDTVLARIEGFATPRVLHLLDLTFHLVYVLIFANYILSAPLYSTYPSRPDYHFYCIALYAVSRILRDPWPSAIQASFVLTLVAFSSALPSMPEAKDSSYRVLLFSFVMHIIQLLLPYSPSLPLLEPRSSTFPLSSMLQNLFVAIFIPAIMFVIPIFMLLLILLATSLNDVFLRADDLMIFDIFLLYLSFFALLLSSLIAFMTLSSSSLPPATFHHPAVPASWSSYGPNVGLSSRHHFSRSVIIYSSPHFYPAPLNLLSLIFVRLPRAILLFFRQEQIASRLKLTVEPTLWRFLVLPLAFVFGIAWLWK